MKLITKSESMDSLLVELVTSREDVIVLTGQAQLLVAQGISLLLSGHTFNIELYKSLANPPYLWGHRMLFFDESNEWFVGMFANRIWIAKEYIKADLISRLVN